MNTLSRDKRVTIVQALVEGCSINSIVRMTSVSKVTILKLLLDIGSACAAFEDARLRKLYCPQIECDEIWSFVYCKAKNVERAKSRVDGMGDCWTWYALDRRSKAIVSWIMGDRDVSHGTALMRDLASRLSNRPQISADGLAAYCDSVFAAFGPNGADFAQTISVERTIESDDPDGKEKTSIETVKKSVFGSPRTEHTSTSLIERANLTLRMTQRRWTRRTNAHSKSFGHMQAAFALHACHYNWVRKHATLKTTPARVLGIADREWSLADLVGLLA